MAPLEITGDPYSGHRRRRRHGAEPSTAHASSAKICANHVLNTCGSSGRHYGNTVGVIGLMYAGLESGMVAVRDRDDWINSVISGHGISALFRATNGPRSIAVAGTLSGILASAAMARKQLTKRYMPAI